MKLRSTHQSYWLNDNPLKQRYEPLSGAHATEVLVIGGGITGLSVAHELLSRGHRVTVCEAEVIGAGTTGGSSGHLDAHPEGGPTALVDRLGLDDAKSFTALRLEAIRKIATRIPDRSGFAEVPAYYYTESPDRHDALRKSFDTTQQLGLRASWCDRVPVSKGASGYRLESFARIDSTKYIQSLAEQVVERGGKIFEKTCVAGVSEDNPTMLVAPGGTVHFEHVVCAVHCNHTSSMRLYFETPAYQSYCLVAKVVNPPLDGLFWDDDEPYHYTRRVGRLDENLVLIGGEDHRTGVGDGVDAQYELEKWLRARYEVQSVISQWSAELFEPTDGLPLIGQVAGSKNVWIATGLSGIGLTVGTASATLIANAIEQRPTTSLLEKLSPQRFGLSKVSQMIGEQMSALGSYAERVLPAELVNPEDLLPGEGAVGKVDGQFVAICRDRDGCEHRVSPVCTHMGGVVHWNEAAQTWDCPVHGGRFTPAGARLYGPPTDDLPDRQGE